MKKCPFRFRKCNRECALLVKVETEKCIGYCCAFAVNASKIYDPMTVAAVFTHPVMSNEKVVFKLREE